MIHKDYDCNLGCPVEAALEVVSGKWRGAILYYLLKGRKRFNEIRRLMPDITQRSLTQQLRDLESKGLISRSVYPEVPPRVEYQITEYGETLRPLIDQLHRWGTDYIERNRLNMGS